MNLSQHIHSRYLEFPHKEFVHEQNAITKQQNEN